MTTVRPKRTAGKREQNKLANRAAILEAAQKTFVQMGYDAVTIRDIIRQTGLASGTFYNYFEDKSELLYALIDQHMGKMATRLTTARRSAVSIERFIYDAYLAFFQEIAENPEFYAMLFRNEPVVRILYNDNVISNTMLMLKQDLRLAISRGLIPEMDTDSLTAILGGAGYEMARMIVERKGKKPEEAATFVTQFFINGLNGFQNSKETALIRRGPLKLDGAAR